MSQKRKLREIKAEKLDNHVLHITMGDTDFVAVKLPKTESSEKDVGVGKLGFTFTSDRENDWAVFIGTESLKRVEPYEVYCARLTEAIQNTSGSRNANVRLYASSTLLLPDSQSPPVWQEETCPKCGKRIIKEGEFCPFCGTQVSSP